MTVSPEFALAIALLRAREAGTEVTDQTVLAECEAADVDPAPVMILVQHKAPAAWPVFVEAPDGTRQIVGARFDGVWFDVTSRRRVVLDAPGAREAVEMLMELDGIREPRCLEQAPFPITVHPSDIPSP